MSHYALVSCKYLRVYSMHHSYNAEKHCTLSSNRIDRHHATSIACHLLELRLELPFQPQADPEVVAHGQQRLWSVGSVALIVPATVESRALERSIRLQPVSLRSRRSPCPMKNISKYYRGERADGELKESNSTRFLTDGDCLIGEVEVVVAGTS